jgi:hypothetical protein
VKQLDEIESRANAATPGPWQTKIMDGVYQIRMPFQFCEKVSDLEFIAAARTDVPKLVKALRVALVHIDFIQHQSEFHLRCMSTELANAAVKAKQEIQSILLQSETSDSVGGG